MYILTVHKYTGRPYISGVFTSKAEAKRWAKELPKECRPSITGPHESLHFPNVIGRWSYVGVQ